MSRTFQSGHPRIAYRLIYSEDVIGASPRRYGPASITAQQLDQLLELTGEKHPIHKSDAFARSNARSGRIIPGGIIQSFTSGWVVRHSIPAAVVDLRAATWEYLRPLYPDQPFFFTNIAFSFSEIDEQLGLVDTERRVFDETEQLYAIGRMNVVMLRRPGGASKASRRKSPRPGESGGKR